MLNVNLEKAQSVGIDKGANGAQPATDKRPSHAPPQNNQDGRGRMLATAGSSGKKPLRNALSNRYSDNCALQIAQPVSRLIPTSRASSRALSAGPSSLKIDAYLEGKASSSKRVTPHRSSTSNDKVKSTGIAKPTPVFTRSCTATDDRTPCAPPTKEAYACNSGVNAIQMDMDNVQLEDKPTSTNKRKSHENEAWGWNDDDEVFISGPASRPVASRQLSTPKVGITGRDIGTIETMYGTLSHSFAVQEEMPWKISRNIPQTLKSSTASTWVVRYVDYTSKYGLGFLLNTGCSGVYFNDSTKIIMSTDGDMFQYIERKRRYDAKTSEQTCETYFMNQYPQELHKKVTLLRHFGNYLIEQEKQDKSSKPSIKSGLFKMSEMPKDCIISPENRSSPFDVTPMIFLKKFVRTRHAILFRLSNKTVQVVFFDRR